MYNDNRILFIQSYLERIVKQLDLVELLKSKQNISQEKAEEKALNTAFEIFAMSVILDKSIDEVYMTAAIIDDSDGGLDGIYFSEDNGKPKMQVFQCKNSKKFGQANLSQNELEKFKNDFDSIFVKGTKKNATGLKHKIKEYDSITATKIIPSCLYFVFNGNKNSQENSRLFQEFHKPNEFEIWDIHDLFNRIYDFIKLEYKRKKVEFAFKPAPSNITAKSDTQALISFAILNVKALLFRLKALELCELFELEKATNGSIEKIFAENIRGFLGKDNSTNEKIAQTLASETQALYLQFLSNDLTIICSKFTVPQATQLGKYVIPCENPVIVNGLQTSYLVYQQYLKDKESLEDVYLTVKLYETQDQELIDLITDATNTQSAIWFKDKLSNKKFNVYTKEFFANKGIGYLTKQGETFTNTDFQHQISSEYLLVNWYRTFLECPNMSSEDILKDIFNATNNSKHSLHKLFNGDVNSPIYSQLYLLYFIQLGKSKTYYTQMYGLAHIDIFVNIWLYKLLVREAKITKAIIEQKQEIIKKWFADNLIKYPTSNIQQIKLVKNINKTFGLDVPETFLTRDYSSTHKALQAIIDKVSNLYIDVSALKIE